MKKINLRDYYPYYTQDMIVEVPDEVALLLREYMLLEEAYRIRTYRYKAFYSLDRDEGIEREILQKPLNPAEIWEQRQMTELIYKGLSKLPVKQRQRIYAHFFSWHEQSRYCQSGRNTQKPDHPFYRSRIA